MPKPVNRLRQHDRPSKINIIKTLEIPCLLGVPIAPDMSSDIAEYTLNR